MIGWFGSTCLAVDLSHGLLIVLVASDLDHCLRASYARLAVCMLFIFA
jgi:hypothetical protein